MFTFTDDHLDQPVRDARRADVDAARRPGLLRARARSRRSPAIRLLVGTRSGVAGRRRLVWAAAAAGGRGSRWLFAGTIARLAGRARARPATLLLPLHARRRAGGGALRPRPLRAARLDPVAIAAALSIAGVAAPRVVPRATRCRMPIRLVIVVGPARRMVARRARPARDATRATPGRSWSRRARAAGSARRDLRHLPVAPRPDVAELSVAVQRR